MGIINQILAKLFDSFKTKYPHQYAIAIIILGGLAYLTNYVPTVMKQIPTWLGTTMAVIAGVYAIVGGTHTPSSLSNSTQGTGVRGSAK